jgi:hypothetical protein
MAKTSPAVMTLALLIALFVIGLFAYTCFGPMEPPIR